MSRAYRLKVSESLRRTVQGSDAIESRIELLGILPPREMADLLGGELERRGFARRGTELVRAQDGTTIAVDPETGTVTLRSDVAREVDLHVRRDGLYDTDRESRDSAEERLREEARQQLEAAAADQSAALCREATERLDQALRNVQAELDAVANRVTAEALKQKAARLGRIKELTEDPESGSLTIVLEV